MDLDADQLVERLRVRFSSGRYEVQIEHSVANGLPPQRKFFRRSCVDCRRNDAEIGPANSLHASA